MQFSFLVKDYVKMITAWLNSSTLSTGLNSMAAVVLEDFYKTCFNNPLSKLHTQILMRATVVIFGAICLAMVFIMDKLGSIVQISMSVSAITNGASLAIFIMGALLPWATGIVRSWWRAWKQWCEQLKLLGGSCGWLEQYFFYDMVVC